MTQKIKACLEIGVIVDWMKYGLGKERRHLHPVGMCPHGRVCRAPESDFLGLNPAPSV